MEHVHFQDFVCLLVRAREFAIRTASRTIQSKIVCQLVDVAKCRLVMTKYVAILQSGIVQLVAKLLLMHRNLITKYVRNGEIQQIQQKLSIFYIEF